MGIVYAVDPVRGKVKAGVFNESSGTFYKSVIRSKHFFKIIGGYAIDEGVYSNLKKLGVKQIVIAESDTKNTYQIPIEVWEAHSGTWNGKSGKQRTLSEKYFNQNEQRH